MISTRIVGLATLTLLLTGACTPKIPEMPPRGTGGSGGTPMDGGLPDQSTFRDVIAPMDTLGMPNDGQCAAQSANAEPVPLDLYLMMDSSKSMLGYAGKDTTTTKWQTVSAVMTAFLNDPQSKGIGVGIQYFPQIQANVPGACGDDATCGANGPCDQHRTCVRNGNPLTVVMPYCDTTGTCAAATETCSPIGTCPSSATGYCAPAGSKCDGGETCTPNGYCRGRDVCDMAAYAAPAAEIAALPGAAPALIASLEARSPDGKTPTAPALTGALKHAQDRATMTPGHKLAVVFVTDGQPESCTPTEIPAISTIAANAAMGVGGKPPVPTFVIGVFTPNEAATAMTNLNMWAASGGTGAAIVINTSQTEAEVRQALQTALNQIRTKALACEYKIPPPTTGAIDFGLVNVDYTSGAGAKSTIGNVPNAAACTAAKGGWHYDVDPKVGKPTSIVACPSTCTQFQADMAGRVDIALGCVTIVIQ